VRRCTAMGGDDGCVTDTRSRLRAEFIGDSDILGDQRCYASMSKLLFYAGGRWVESSRARHCSKVITRTHG
jgi:hypothetical protein